LTNVARHAQATLVNIQIDLDAYTTRMVIHDNGVGFDSLSSQNDDRFHWGVRIMAERAESVGGTCRVDSVPSQGTQIVVEVKS
jgi:nitrate/nitrite-specific signal transduction histidine kinase